MFSPHSNWLQAKWEIKHQPLSRESFCCCVIWRKECTPFAPSKIQHVKWVFMSIKYNDYTILPLTIILGIHAGECVHTFTNCLIYINFVHTTKTIALKTIYVIPMDCIRILYSNGSAEQRSANLCIYFIVPLHRFSIEKIHCTTLAYTLEFEFEKNVFDCNHISNYLRIHTIENNDRKTSPSIQITTAAIENIPDHSPNLCRKMSEIDLFWKI